MSEAVAIKVSEPRCPFCLHALPPGPASSCPNSACREPLPAGFFKRCQDAPPAWLVPLGLSGHGKSALRKGMLLAAERLSDLIDADTQPLDPETRAAAMRTRAEEQDGGSEGEDDEDRPWLMSLSQAAMFGDRTLILADTSSQALQEPGEHPCPVVGLADPLLLVVSLRKLKEQSQYRLQDLLGAYLTLLEKHGTVPGGRTLVVVYTMADCDEAFGSEIDTYLMGDPLAGSAEKMFDLSGYLKEMSEVSKKLEQFTRGLQGGSTFLGQAARQNVTVRFCVTSPRVGRAPDQGAIPIRRVLDPLFWVLRSAERKADVPDEPDRPVTGTGKLLLLLDATEQSKPVYADGLPLAFWEAMRAHGTVTTYYLGRGLPVSPAGQRPPADRGRKPLVRLIGPILEKAPAESRLVVLTNGPIHDLGDFNVVRWHERLLVVSPNEELEGIWPRLFPYRAGDEARAALGLLELEG